MYKKSLIAALIVALLLAGCATAKSAQNPILVKELPVEVERQAVMEMPASAGEGYAADSMITMNQPNQLGEGSQRMVIRNADLRIVVDDPAESMKSINNLAEEMGGFVVASQLYKIQTEQGLEAPEATITVRVPAERLNEALDKVKAMVKNPKTDVLSENVSGQDVTKEYTDLSSQLTNLENAEKQLQKIMEEAYTTEDVMLVYNRLVEVRNQIEIIKGQMKYYEEASSLSAISLKLVAEATLQPLEIGGWKPQGVARDAIQNLIYFWQGFIDFMINFLLYVLPVLITIFIPFYLVFLLIRAIYRRVRRKKPAPAIENK